MNNTEQRVEAALDLIQGPLIADNLLEELKKALLNEQVFKVMFGNLGERIFIEKMPNYNQTITPFIEFYWGRDTYTNHDVHFNGTLVGRIGLPAKLHGDSNKQRRLATALQIFFGTKSCSDMATPTVPGLIEFGVGSTFDYDRLLDIDGLKIPVIAFTIPYKIDLRLYELANQGTDFRAKMDGEGVPDFEAYTSKLINELSTVLIEGEVSLED